MNRKRRFTINVAIAGVLSLATTQAAAVPVVSSGLLLSEVFYDAPGRDDGFEWVEVFNATRAVIDLSAWTLGYGGASYASALTPLSGLVGSGEYFVIGGPVSAAANASPVFDLAFDFEPDLQNAGRIADGVALFNRPVGDINASTVPHDAVIYGEQNISDLLGVLGEPGQVSVVDVGAGSSIERSATLEWQVNATPRPGVGRLDAVSLGEPGAAELMLVAMLLCTGWRWRTRHVRTVSKRRCQVTRLTGLPA